MFSRFLRCTLSAEDLPALGFGLAGGMPERGLAEVPLPHGREQYKAEKDQLLLQLTSIDITVNSHA
jgi:hypothetical protein